MPNTQLSPLFKWTGGKRRELPIIRQFYPSFVKAGQEYLFVEPFVGAGAVFWDLDNVGGRNIINDFDEQVANFYQVMRDQEPDFLRAVQDSSALYTLIEGVDRHDEQERNYYYWRNLDRDNGLEGLDAAKKAARFWIVNQLAFSGMRRFNAGGEFNVPYGHYKNLNSGALSSPAHVGLLQQTDIFCGDYKAVVDANDEDNTFIFLDPPYTRVMKKYSADNEFGEDKQRELAETLLGLKKASWMLVIDKSELTMELYGDHVTHTYPLSYGVNIKNRFDTQVEHILVTNY